MTTQGTSSLKGQVRPFTANLGSRELPHSGHRIRLQAQPFSGPEGHLEYPNKLITWEELPRRVRPKGTFVDLAPGLNEAINILRDALGGMGCLPNGTLTFCDLGVGNTLSARFIGAVIQRTHSR